MSSRIKRNAHQVHCNKRKSYKQPEKMQITDKGMIIRLKMTHHQQLKAEDVEYHHQCSIRKNLS